MSLRRCIALSVVVASLAAPLAGAAASEKHRPLPARWSAWRLNLDTYGADGAPEVYAENGMALRPRGTDWGAVKELLAFCQAHKTAFLIKTGGYWGRSLLGLAYGVTYRVNEGPPVAEIWPGTETLDAALAPGGAVAFMQSLPDEGSVSFAVTDALGQEHEATFRLKGVARARELMARACSKPL